MFLIRQLDQGTFEICFHGQVVGWVWSSGNRQDAHEEHWALRDREFPHVTSATPIALSFKHTASHSLPEFHAFLNGLTTAMKPDLYMCHTVLPGDASDWSCPD